MGIEITTFTFATHTMAFGAGGLFSAFIGWLERRFWRKEAEKVRASIDRDELLLTERYLADENAHLKARLADAYIRGPKGRFQKAVL